MVKEHLYILTFYIPMQAMPSDYSPLQVSEWNWSQCVAPNFSFPSVCPLGNTLWCASVSPFAWPISTYAKGKLGLEPTLKSVGLINSPSIPLPSQVLPLVLPLWSHQSDMLPEKALKLWYIHGIKENFDGRILSVNHQVGHQGLQATLLGWMW